MQAAGDSAALMLSKTAQGMTSEQLNTKATELFNALLNRPDVINLAVTTSFSNPSSGFFKLDFTVIGQMPTVFSKFIGKDSINLGSASEVVWGVKRLELALALDVTLSMNDSNKLNELKKAAKSLLGTLKKVAKKDGDVKISVVPFSVHVNVDTTNVNADWLDWGDWMAEPASMTAWLQNSDKPKRLGAHG
jgi:hypothetical protein